MAKVVYDFYMTQAARALEIACDSRKRKSYRLNRPLHIHKCVRCRRQRRSIEGQKMADLPQERVESTPPFTYCGMDALVRLSSEKDVKI